MKLLNATEDIYYYELFHIFLLQHNNYYTDLK